MFQPNFVHIESMSLIPNYGYVRTPSASIPRSNALESPTEIITNQIFLSTVLWPVLFKIFPSWNLGLQATGDCVSWMHSHMADLTEAIRFLWHPNPTGILKTASEATYAFGKCELKNSYRFHSPGMMGIDAVLAVEKFGRLLRKQYEVGDLSYYNGAIAEGWAERPKSTHGVPDVLEAEASKHKFLNHLEITDCMTAAAFIEAGYPVGYCGDTRWGIETNNKGEATRYAFGSHAMVLTGVRYENKRPAFFWVANTGHGDHVFYRGANSAIPQAYSNCGSWVPQEHVQPVLERGDCFAISVDGVWNVHKILPECFDPLNFV